METTSKRSAHTPGPWTVVEKRGSTYSSPCPEIRAGNTSIADIRWNGHNEEHGQANAALIAAAPELLECLELMDVQLSHLPDTAYTDYLTQRVRNAIKEAKGAQQ